MITHLFADGGRIVGSKKTSYVEHLGSEALQGTVKKLMQAQHKAMFIALRDGIYDEDASGEHTGTHQVSDVLDSARAPEGAVRAPKAPTSARGPEGAVKEKPLYQGTLPAAPPEPSPQSVAPTSPAGRQSIFGSDLMSEKSLDEVILSYLATDEQD